jgi:hypothetical protein
MAARYARHVRSSNLELERVSHAHGDVRVETPDLVLLLQREAGLIYVCASGVADLFVNGGRKLNFSASSTEAQVHHFSIRIRDTLP